MEAATVTYLFSDIESSTRLWEADPARAARTIAWHDGLSRAVVQRHRGALVKMTGDGMHAAFDDPVDALAAVVDLQLALKESDGDRAPLGVRCGLHLGADERRDDDFFGPAVNRAARIMSAAHGGQVLVSQAVADRVAEALPPAVVLRDLGSVRLRDLGSPERLYQVVHPGLRSEFPPLRSMASTPNNLAQQLNSFIGRDRDIEQLKALLASTRLLTLFGMGGLGKSRLSVQLAAIVLDDYADGVWFVELAALAEAALVPQAVASAIGVREEPGGSVIDALVRYARDRRMLIVLDNCEHVVDECAAVAKTLLQADPNLRMLVSSREPLRIAGETVFQVAPLATPAAQERPAPDALLANDAVRLFVDRAAAVRSSFQLVERNASAVAEICRRLDGIPLALELAAARTAVLPVESIAARLSDRFRLLVSGDRTALPRQQTLRALIDWSYDLLAETERLLFQRLAVFAGGWTLEAAETVCVGGAISADAVMNLLANLVQESLVQLEPEGRYRMLDTVRQYAADRLAEGEDDGTTRTRHLRWALNFAETARPGLAGPEQGRWLAELDVERENLLTAHRWCDQAEDGVALGLQLVFVLKLYWYQRGLLTLGHRVTAEALQRTRASDRSVLRCRGLADVGQFCSFMGRYSEARRLLEESLAIARELGDERRIAAVLQPLGYACMGEGDMACAQRHFGEGIEVARSVGNPRQLASALTYQAQLLRQRGQLDEAEQLYLEVVDCACTLGDQESVAIGQLSLAIVAIETRAPDRARLLLDQALRTTATTGSQLAGQAALDVMAGWCAAIGDGEAAARFYGASEMQAERSGLRRDSADAGFLMPRIERVRAELSAVSFEHARADGAGWTYEAAIQRASERLARAAEAAGITPC